MDLNRDVLMRLIRIIKTQTEVKNILGMCETFYSWSKRDIFSWAVGLSFTLLPDSFTFDVYTTERKLTFSTFCSSHRTYFIDKEIKEGVWRCDFEASGKNYGSGHFFGLATKAVVWQIISMCLGKTKDSCMFAYCCLYINGQEILVSPDLFPTNGANTITLELNMGPYGSAGVDGNENGDGILFITVNGKQGPCCITEVPPSVYMGFSGHASTVVEIKSFRRLRAPSIESSLAYAAFPWR